MKSNECVYALLYEEFEDELEVEDIYRQPLANCLMSLKLKSILLFKDSAHRKPTLTRTKSIVASKLPMEIYFRISSLN